jgi:hypothetical protein
MDADRDAFDELTALFTSDAEPAPLELVGGDAVAQVALECPMHLTIAICGHLPVMAGLWVTQYADRVGARCGPTGLLRLEGGRCSLELFRTPRAAARIDQGSSLLESLKTVGASLRRWIICVDESDVAEGVRCGVDEVVVLTGADKPAVLAAYRIVKTAAARVKPDEDLGLGLVVVGADAARSEAVGDVLAVAAHEFMNRPLGVVDTIQRMDVVESARRMLFAERERAAPGDAISLLRSLGPKVVAVEEAQLESEHDVSLRFIDSEPLGEERTPVRRRDTVRLPPIVPPYGDGELELEVKPEATPRPTVLQQEPEPAVQPQPVVRPAPAPVEPLRRESDPEGLGAHFPEFTPVAFRCPVAKGIELAVDQDGRLRLLCRCGELADARIAASWAQANEALLRAALSSLGDGPLEPIIDLVTKVAESVADLHRTGIRLYLLSSLEIEGGLRWFRVDLNSAQTACVPD